MGNREKTLGTLSELENLFPTEAPRAAMYKAIYLKEAGDKKRAIAAAKHVAIAYKTAAEAGARQTEMVPQHIQQRGVPLGADLLALAVHQHGDPHGIGIRHDP